MARHLGDIKQREFGGPSFCSQTEMQSSAVLEMQRAEALDELTCIRLRSDDAENHRRIMEENNRLDRYESLQIEAVTSGRKNAAIEMKWADLLNMDIPQELNDNLQVQKVACKQIIASKDRRIEDFKVELKNKDLEYVKMLKQQSSDISTLIEKMRKQYHTLRQHYVEQLQQVEEAFDHERTEQLSKNKCDIDALFEKRRQQEESEFLKDFQERDQSFKQAIEELRSGNEYSYSKGKITLEKGLQELEQHGEQMNAMYLLNEEKLNHNREILKERTVDQKAIEKSYKYRIQSLHETLNKLMSRYNTMDQKYKHENLELTKEYKHLSQQFKELQEQFHHLEQADYKKFREVWNMNAAEVQALVTKVQAADKLVHEQQLGHEWLQPNEELLQQEADSCSGTATATGRSSAMGSSSRSSGKSGMFSASKVRKVLDLILEEAQFLLDVEVGVQVAKLPVEQRAVLQIEALLRYIGVEDQRDLDLLVQVFFSGQDVDDEALMVDADDVFSLLKEFMQERENMRIADVVPSKKKGKARAQQVGRESQADQKARRRREERKFWERKGHAIPDMNLRVWKATDVFLKRYYELLQKRGKDIHRVAALQKQNEVFKALLDQHLSSKVNERLQVPPTHMISIAGN
eukprot:TRINITY_DN109990_c0_g1_i1.p1 TRINITY_DN109990_c0_g1~~TRINITY_DN109990_c0_g1_i1.p1  ORF type:complete len:634 (-),score=198.19 TRINITY_DN109990_c0_g1_i1:225-2126(-)